MRHPAKPDIPPMLLVHWLDADSTAGEAPEHSSDPDCYSVGIYTGDDLRRMLTVYRDVYVDGSRGDRGRIPIGTIVRWARLRIGKWQNPDELDKMRA